MAIRRAELWMVWREDTAESDAFEYQAGAALEITGLMRALYVRSKTSFDWPQLAPTRALRMLKREWARSAVMRAWGEKVKWVSLRVSSDGDTEGPWNLPAQHMSGKRTDGCPT